MAALPFRINKLKSRARAEINNLPDFLLEAERAARSVFFGEHMHRRAGTGEHFWQYREYTSSDRLKDIDWRQSAKGDRVYIRQRELQTLQNAVIWCDSNKGMDYRSKASLPTKRHASLILGLALTIGLARQGEQLSGFNAGPFKGVDETITEKMGKALIDKPLPFHALATQKPNKNSTVFLLSDFLTPLEDIETLLDHLALTAERGFFIQVLDPAELDLPFSGHVLFKTPDGKEPPCRIDNVAAIRSAYKERIDSHNKALTALAEKHGWSRILHPTTQPYTITLMALYEQLNRKAVQ